MTATLEVRKRNYTQEWYLPANDIAAEADRLANADPSVTQEIPVAVLIELLQRSARDDA